MKLLDEAGNIVQRGNIGDDELFMVKLNEDLYQNEKGDALLALGHPDAALEALLLVERSTESGLQRRYARNEILQAKAYVAKGLYPMATALAESALAQVKTLGSGLNVARIASLYDELKKSSYGSHSDVAMLGVELMKVQHPQIFR